MGRYYSGQISGKFWFGIQSSVDACNFGAAPEHVINYHVCGCTYEPNENENDETQYCRDCFESCEQHKQEIIDEEIECYDNKKTWAVSESELSFSFGNAHIEQVIELVNELEEQVGKYIPEYVIKDEDDEITYNCDKMTQNMTNDEHILVARLCLGKQILYCLEKHDSCNFYAEI